MKKIRKVIPPVLGFSNKDMSDSVIKDVAARTNGEIYLGVVGSVRSGKSTFIRRFIERKVLPLVEEESVRQKIVDELPQSGDGKTIMTVEPKFIPSNQTFINFEDVGFNVRLVDCVGYVIPSAKGYLNEDGTNRMVKTPWFTEEVSFQDAATIGTKKVIDAHSHVGIIITSDGSFGEFSENEYDDVLENVVGELQNADKPFVIVLNTLSPNSDYVKEKVANLKEQYGTAVIALNVNEMTENDIDNLLKEALSEFKINDLSIDLPQWVSNLNANISYKAQLNEVLNDLKQYERMKDAYSLQETLVDSGLFESAKITEIDSGTGNVTISLEVNDEIYNSCIEEIIGDKLDDKSKLIEILQEYQENKFVCNKIKPALKGLETQGYGIALPEIGDMQLSDPELSKQGGRYGIKINATAPAIFMVKIDVESTFEPIIGSKEQAEVLVEHMTKDSNDNIWNSEIFGRKLCDVINDGVRAKINAIPEVVQYKYKDAINKVVNKTKGGVIAIVL